MSQMSGGPVNAQSIMGQMGGVGSGTTNAPISGYPAPDPSIAPPTDSTGSPYYSTTNPFSVGGPDASTGGAGGASNNLYMGNPALLRQVQAGQDPTNIDYQGPVRSLANYE